MRTEFLSNSEAELALDFMTHGHVIRAVEDCIQLDRIRALAAGLAAAHLGLSMPADPGGFLDNVHTLVSAEKLNDLRLAVISGFNAVDWVRPAYYSLARNTLAGIVGNELAMQLRLNLSIQLPNDSSSLLPLHADVWNGDSPYEVVLWLPLVDCHSTKSMFLLPPDINEGYQQRLKEYRSTEELYTAVKDKVRFLDVPYGKFLLFSQNLMHGNRINIENSTRWSMNCRFKGAFTPYADKRLGEFFEPITLRPATRLGAAYRLPDAEK